MTGPTEGQSGHDSFDDCTPYPSASRVSYPAINHGRHTRPGRRTPAAGSVAAALPVAWAIAGVVLVGCEGGDNGDGGSPTPHANATAVTSPPSVSSDSPAAPPSEGAGPTTSGTPIGTPLVLASGTTPQGTKWEVVRTLEKDRPPHEWDAWPSPGPGEPEMRMNMNCEPVDLQIGGKVAAALSGHCVSSGWPWEDSSTAPIIWISAGGSDGQSVIVAEVTPVVARVSITLANGTRLPDTAPVPVPNTPEAFVVVAVPADIGSHEGLGTIKAFDAQGGQVDEDTFPSAH